MNKTFKKFSYIFLSVVSLGTLTSCNMEGFGDDLAENIESKLIPNIWAFLVQLIALIVLLLIVYFLAYKPVKKVIEKRKEMLHSEVVTTKENRKKSEANLLESEKRLANTKKEANKIIEKANAEASRSSQEIIDLAHKEIVDMREKAHKEISNAKNEAMKELHDEIVDVAIDASSKVLSREVTKKDNSKIVDDFIKDLDKNENK